MILTGSQGKEEMPWQNISASMEIPDDHIIVENRSACRIGLKCTGVGSHVAPYCWPGAVIREFVAVDREKKHLILFLTGRPLCMILMAVIR